MNREELAELHYITPIANVPSILEHGILSHRRAQRFRPQSIAKPEVQDVRANVNVPGGRALHEYANLYICARNPMMYKRAALHGTICVLRVSPAVLDLPGAIVTDQNAASGTLCSQRPQLAWLSSIELPCLLTTGDIREIRSRTIAIAPSSALRCWFRMP